MRKACEVGARPISLAYSLRRAAVAHARAVLGGIFGVARGAYGANAAAVQERVAPAHVRAVLVEGIELSQRLKTRASKISPVVSKRETKRHKIKYFRCLLTAKKSKLKQLEINFKHS